jgi:hypothetical protein
MFETTGYCYAQNPTIRNTPKGVYNCGGYAFNLFKWYVPTRSWEDYENVRLLLDNECYEAATKTAVNYMRKDLGYTVVSNDEVFNRSIDYKKYEIVAFRYEMMGEDSDFHYMKIGKNGNWYEKRGSGSKIYRHEYYYVFRTWAHRYDGPIVFLIKEREP